MPLTLTLTNEEKILVTAVPQTAHGHPAQVDGQVEFTVDTGTCTIERVDDLSVKIVSGDAPGDSTVLVHADADLGAGIEPLDDVITVHVVGAKAQSLGLTEGTAEPK